MVPGIEKISSELDSRNLHVKNLPSPWALGNHRGRAICLSRFPRNSPCTLQVRGETSSEGKNQNHQGVECSCCVLDHGSSPFTSKGPRALKDERTLALALLGVKKF